MFPSTQTFFSEWHPRRLLHIFLQAVRLFQTSEIMLRASALTYYTLFSIVPILALLFGFAKGFGLEDWLKEEMLSQLPAHSEILNKFYLFAETTLREAKGGVVAGVGALLLCWSVIKMIGNIENAFNKVWNIQRSRTFFRKFTDYLSCIIIMPVLSIATSSATVLLSGYLRKAVAINTFLNSIGTPAIDFTIHLIPFLLAWVLFTFLYSFLPNTRVNFSAALFGGIIAGTLDQLLRNGYLVLQLSLSQYNVIYGSFSILPLFLIYFFLTWMIVLLGVILCYLFQNFDYQSVIDKDQERAAGEKKMLALLLAAEVADDFVRELPPPDAVTLARKCGISRSLTQELLQKLLDCRVIVSVSGDEYDALCYVPGLPQEKLTIHQILMQLEEIPQTIMTLPERDPRFALLGNSLQNMVQEIKESPSDRPLLSLATSQNSQDSTTHPAKSA